MPVISHNSTCSWKRAYGLLLLAGGLVLAATASSREAFVQAPEFTQTGQDAWLNSPALRIKDLRGQVVLMDIWTFGCWNCYRSFPWLHSVEARFGSRGFTVIGIHAPEFAHEKNRDAVVEKAKEFQLHHPIMIDNNHAYWRALNNRYWPAYYVIDKRGRIRGTFIGETHQDDAQARRVESLIDTLLKEEI